MDSHEIDYSDIEVEVVDEAGLREAIDNALELAGCTWEELQEQAKAGRFSTHIARKVWFVVSTFEPSTA